MDGLFSSVRRMFEKDPATAFFTVLVIVLIILGIWLYRNRTKDKRSPDIIEHEGYYRITLTPTGYSITSSRNLFGTLSTFYYLRKDPFNIEVIIDKIEAENGKNYRARAVVSVVLQAERIDSVCRRYFNGEQTPDSSEAIYQMLNGRGKSDYTTDILSSDKKKTEISSDELFLQAMRDKKSVSFSADAYKRSPKNNKKTNCDADIDADLTIAFSSAIKKLVEDNGGNLSEEEMRKKFFGLAMLGAITYGHTVTEVSAFDIIEITE